MFIKCSPSLEDTLTALYDGYVLADDSTLTEDAIELKEHYKFVIKDLELHDELKFISDQEKLNEDENDAYARYSLAKTLEEYFKIHNIRVVPELELFDGNEVVNTHSITYPVSEDFCRDLVDIMYEGDE